MPIVRLILAALTVALTVGAYLGARYLLLRQGLKLLAARRPGWEQFISVRRLFSRIAYLAPGIVLYLLLPLALTNPDFVSILQETLLIYFVVMFVLVLNATVNASMEIYDTFTMAKNMPLTSLGQVIIIGNYILGGTLLLSVIFGVSLVATFGTLAAVGAVIAVAFNEPIKGFAASIQLAANHMVAIGDWIEMPDYGADGIVLEINLTSVKVRNWDKTLVMVPTYAMITRSFKNWRGMYDSGGRRIRRSVLVDLTTIRFCTDEMFEQLAAIETLADYLAANKPAAQNTPQRTITNVDAYIAYITAYLHQHPAILSNLVLYVRQLEPTAQGLPIQITAFSQEQSITAYENVQGAIMSHIIGIAPEFDLCLFQQPSGTDFAPLRPQKEATPPERSA